MHRRSAWLVGLSILAWVNLCTHLHAQRKPDVRVDTDPPGSARSEAHQIAASGDAVYVVWVDERVQTFDSNIYFNRSLDGGGTWLSSDVLLNTDQFVFEGVDDPQIRVFGNAVYVIWDGYLGTRFNRSLDRGDTWLPVDILIPDSRGNAQFANSGESLYLVWTERPTAGYETDVYFTRSLDGGDSWDATVTRLDTDPLGSGWSGTPLMEASGDNVYVIWKDTRDGLSDVYFNRSLDRGASWLAEDVRLDSDPAGFATSTLLSLAVSGDRVHVAWQDLRSSLRLLGHYDIRFNSSSDAGTTWQPFDIRLNTNFPGSSYSRSVHLAASGDSVYALWFDDRDGSNGSYFNRSEDGGVTWLPRDQRLDDPSLGTQGGFGGQLIAAGQNLFTVWSDRRSGSSDIYFNRSDDGGRSWLPIDVRLDSKPPGTTWSVIPVMARSEDSIYIAWRDSRNGDSDIYFTIPYGSHPYGEGTPGTGGFIPSLRGSDSLTIGSTFSLTVSDGLGAAFGVLAWGGPGSKTSIPLAGGSLLVHPIVQMRPFLLDGTADAAGEGDGAQFFMIPRLPEFIGFNVNFQAVFLDPLGQAGVTLTNAVEAWIL